LAFDFTGSFSGSFFGDITASNGVVSSSAQIAASLPAGTLSGSNQVQYNSILNRPTTITAFQKNSITANTNFRETTFPSISSSIGTRLTTLESATDNTGSEQTLSFNDGTNALSISNGNSVDLSSLAGGGGGGAGLNITASNEGTALSKMVRSFDFVGNAVTATNSGNAVTVTINTGSGGGSVPSGTISSSAQLPSGILSSSAQLPSGLVSSSAQLPSGILSSSAQLPSGLISSSITSVDSASVAELSNYTAQWTLGADGANHYTFRGPGLTGAENDPTLYLMRGQKYKFINNMGAHPFRIQSTPNGSAGSAYNDGITNNDVSNGTLLWDVQFDSPRVLYYQCTAHANMGGVIYIDNANTGSAGGGSTNIVPLNNFTGSAQTSINALNAATSSYLTSVPDGTVSSSAQITALGFGGGGSFNATPLNNFTGSAQTSINALNAATSSYLTSVPSGTISSSVQLPSGIVSSSAQITALGFGGGGGGATNIVPLNNFTGSAQVSINALNTFTGSAISNSQTSSMSVATASFASGFTIFDGNRVISNTNLPAGVYNTNAGTSGSLSQFIEKVFFPNTVPSITTNGFTIGEFVSSGSSVGTVTATDAEGQSITFRTASAYTADKFRISSAGAITLNTKSTSSLNTDNTPGSGSHPFLVEAVDTFSGVGSKTIYIRVTPNTAPKWRQTSVGGSVVTTFTQSLNENSTAGNNKVRVYFTDDEGDTITIGSGSVPSGFTFTKTSTYVQLNQTTASLDYETTPKYELVLTASDEHYQSGDDTAAIAYLPFQIAVVDNVGPTVNDQTLGSINENSANGASVGSITATDPTDDTITFSNFTLKEANLDGGSNITSSLGGNSLYDPHSDPFQCSSAGVVTRKNGVYLNSDVANRYFYQVTVKDAFNTTSDTGLIRINIADNTQSTISDNWTVAPYIIESAVDGNSVRISSNGRTGTIAQWSSVASQRWELTSENDLIEVTNLTGSTTELRVKNDISGSANSFDGDNRISVALTASEHGFETTKQYIDVDVRVAINNAPVPSFSNTSANLNTNGARSGSTITTISFTDTESDTLNHNSFTFTDPSGQLNSVKSGDSYLIQATNNLSASAYEMTASIKDTHGFRVGTTNHSLTIAQAPIGTLGGNTTSHIIESAVSGSVIRSLTGFGGGSPSQLTVSYAPEYNSAAVQSFTSSNAAIGINNSGNLTMKVHVSGSSTGSGDTITSTITYRDQFDNIGSGSLTVNVFANQAPTATFSEVGANMTASVAASTNLTTITISDTESDTPFSASLGGTDAGNLKLVPQNANSSSYQLQSAGTISSGVTYNYSASIFDNFDKSTSYNRSITILDPVAKTYVYGWDGGSAASEAAAIASLGDSGADGVDITSGSVIAHLQSGSLGKTFNPSFVGGQMLLFASSSKATLSDSSATGLSSFGYVNFSGGSRRLVVVFPSASNQGGKPVSMYDGVPPDSTGTANEYYVYAKDAAIPGTIGTGVYYFNTENAVEGYSKWGMVFAEGENTNNSRYYLMPDSASAP